MKKILLAFTMLTLFSAVSFAQIDVQETNKGNKELRKVADSEGVLLSNHSLNDIDADYWIQDQALSSTSLCGGETVNASCRQYSTGTESVDNTVYVGYYLSTNTTYDGSDIQLGEDPSSIGSDTYDNENQDITIPSGTSPGTYYILFYADHREDFAESNEANNIEYVQISVNDASFSYSSGTYCTTASDPTPTITGVSGGTFSAPAALIINSSTGTIDVSASTIGGPYTVTYATSGDCANSSTVNITITTGADAEFSYSTPVCNSGVNPQPNHTTGNNGVYSSTAGLVFINTGTGEIDLSSTTPGIYTITNFVDLGVCGSDTKTFDITINPLPTVGAGGDLTVCEGESVILTATNPDGANISWDNSVIDGVTFIPANTGVITYTVSADLAGCISTDIVDVTVSPTDYINENIELCEGSIYLFGTQTINSAGEYTETFTNINNCDSVVILTVSTNELPQIDIQTTDAACGNEDGAAVATVSGGSSPYSFFWSNGDNTSNTDELANGMHSLLVTDDNGCSVSEYFTINSSDGPVITLNSQTNVSCFGGNNGALHTNISTSIPIIEWSNGAITNDITNLVSGPYDITVTDDNGCSSTQTFEITQPDELAVSFTTADADCGSSNGSASANVTGGVSPYNYSWGTGTNEISAVSAGTYELTVTDDNGCELASSVNISNVGALGIVVDDIQSAACGSGGAIYVSINGASGSQTYSWSNGFFGEDLIGYGAGTYTLTVEDGACIVMMDIEIPSVIPNAQELCVVTVDDVTGNNLVVWEKEASTSISHYNIYRETSWPGMYLFVDSVLYDDMSEFHDPVANPMVRAWRYKISTVDNCGMESDLSIEHKTIHLSINAGLGGAYNLIWDDYEGFAYGTFYINRYLNSEGWLLLDSLPNNLHSYTDIPPNVGGLAYSVTINAPNACVPTSAAKASGGPYYQSSSNIEDEGIVDGITNKDKSESAIAIYPNPTTGKVTIVAEEIDFVEITNISGQVISKQKVNSNKFTLDISSQAKGIYFIKVIGNNEISIHKLILE